jgi:hypothetical protein
LHSYMKKLLISLSGLSLFFGFLAPKSFAQIEFFGGYSYLEIGNVPATERNANGWDASLSTHLLGSLGLEADYSDHYGVSPTNTQPIPKLTQLYGPRYQLFSFPRIEPFVHALFGTVNGTELGLAPGVPCIAEAPCPRVSENSFGMAFGGGLNIKATGHIWMRLFQVDYVREQFSGNPENDVRVSAGLVLRFGRW